MAKVFIVLLSWAGNGFSSLDFSWATLTCLRTQYVNLLPLFITWMFWVWIGSTTVDNVRDEQKLQAFDPDGGQKNSIKRMQTIFPRL